MTKSPATSIGVPKLISRTRRIGLLRDLMQRTVVMARAARHVGRPKSFFNEDAARSTITMTARSVRTSLPLPLRLSFYFAVYYGA